MTYGVIKTGKLPSLMTNGVIRTGKSSIEGLPSQLILIKKETLTLDLSSIKI